jgi:hypothetical protein
VQQSCRQGPVMSLTEVFSPGRPTTAAHRAGDNEGNDE